MENCKTVILEIHDGSSKEASDQFSIVNKMEEWGEAWNKCALVSLKEAGAIK